MTAEQTRQIQLINSELEAFAPISLEEMKAVRLMNRIDAKFVIPLARLAPLLHVAASEYFVQQIEGKNTAAYHTVYYDTADHRMYNIHQSGRAVRQKIRVRTYEETGTTFLEIKNKNNRGRTKKKRIEIEGTGPVFSSEEARQFIEVRSWFSPDQIRPHVENFFDRITLVNRGMTERLTIDLGLRYHNFEVERESNLQHLAIIELKRNGRTQSPMRDIFLDQRIHPGGFSKYCIGCATTNPELRRNNLIEKIRRIERMRG